MKELKDEISRLHAENAALREERLAFKGKMRSYASEFRRRSVGQMVFAQSVSDDMMNLADRLGSEYDDVDPRAWKHLLVYAPKESPAAVARPSDRELLAEWVRVSTIAEAGERRLAVMRAVLAKWGAPQADSQPAPGKSPA